jgi:hypothetical protein
MPIRVSWDNPWQTVARYDFDGRWTWEEFVEATQQCNDLVRSQPHIVNVLADMRKGIVPSRYAIMQVKNAYDRAAANTGLLIIVTTDRFITMLYQAFRLLYPDLAARIRIYDDMDEARAELTESAADLTPL